MSKEHTLKVISAVVVNHRRREPREIIKIDDDQYKRLGGAEHFEEPKKNDIAWAKEKGLYSVDEVLPNIPDQDLSKVKKPGESNGLPAWATGEKEARLKKNKADKKAEKATPKQEVKSDNIDDLVAEGKEEGK